ncbi:MAG: hypothetical protein JWP27_3042 [Flaviaesturariibacter sp.]|nr:hypothetical protein [Flaviaesturariibacter sp.]
MNPTIKQLLAEKVQQEREKSRTCVAASKPVARHYCGKSRQPCATPYTCSPACRLVTASSDSATAPAKPPFLSAWGYCWTSGVLMTGGAIFLYFYFN